MVNLAQKLESNPPQRDHLESPIAKPQTLESRVALEGVSWSTFQTLLAEVGENRSSRFTYDQGVLEIRMPLQAHEEPLGMIESAIEALADELDLEIKKLGATSLKRADLKKFVEPDTCFYIQNEAAVRQKSAIDLGIDPPLDLAIESDYTNSSLSKFSLYAALGVPELWCYQQQNLEIYLLVDGDYQKSPTSLAFPTLLVAEIPQLIEQSKVVGQRAAIRLFRENIKAILSSQNI